MTMWIVVLITVLAAAAIALIYVIKSFSRFGFIDKLAKGDAKHRLAISFAVIVAGFLITVLTINFVNAIICLIHLAVFFFIGNLLFNIIRRIRKKDFSCYYAGAVAILACAAYLAMGWYQDYHIWTERYTITTTKDVSPLKIVQIADSHIGTTFDGKGFAKHLAKIQEENPDIVLITGDFVDDGTSREDMVASCQALGNLRTVYGVYFAFGNHDKGYHNPALRGFTGNDLINELKKNDVVVLEDEIALLNNGYVIIGRKDLSEIQRGRSRLNMKQLMQSLDKTMFSIVMDHQPNDYANQAEVKVDLVLSGHTHGGQLFPLNRIGEWIGANDRTYGFETRDLTDFIVTSGLSDWAVKFKTGCRSEYVIITIQPDKAAN